MTINWRRTVMNVRKAMWRLGTRPALRYDLQRARHALGIAPPVVELTARRSRYRLSARPNSTDFLVFGQTFIGEPYACLDDLTDVSFIIDCGANAGFASAFLLSRFPDASLVAIEPDPDTFRILERNLAPYGPRVRAEQAGVWSHTTDLRIEERPYRGGGAWARQVRPCAPGEVPTLHAVDIPTLLAQSGRDRISILKIDIEGAEFAVFSAPNVASWLPLVDCLVIELHDDTHFGPCTEVFQRAIADQPFDVSQVGELTVCRRV
jgi:FkbM family methyltransferase